MERKEGLTKGLCGWPWSQIFLRGRGEVSVDQLCLGSLQSSDTGKVLSSTSPKKEVLTLVSRLPERLQNNVHLLAPVLGAVFEPRFS